MGTKSTTSPVTSYEEYLRRYLPTDSERIAEQWEDDPGSVGTEAAREAIQKVDAALRAQFASRT